METRRVNITGAGPAGLAAAITVARHGVNAVVYEQRPRVGGRFHGDSQGLENWTTPGDVLEELASIGIEPSFDYVPFKEVMVFDPSGRPDTYRSAVPFFYLVRRGTERGTLDTDLVAQALRTGVEIRFDEARHHLPHGGIVAQGPRSADAMAVGRVFETDAADGAYAALSERLAPKGYAYLLVSRGHGTVASCIFDDFHSEKLYLQRTLDFFQRTVNVPIRNPRPFGGVGNLFYPRTARSGRLLFAGEAAGFQDPLWGFGMRYAMLSGHLAALAILENTPETDDRLWRQRLGGLMRSGAVNRYLFSRLHDRSYCRFAGRLSRQRDHRAAVRRLYQANWWKSLSFPFAERSLRRQVRAVSCLMENCDCTFCRCLRELNARPEQSAGNGAHITPDNGACHDCGTETGELTRGRTTRGPRAPRLTAIARFELGSGDLHQHSAAPGFRCNYARAG